MIISPKITKDKDLIVKKYFKKSIISSNNHISIWKLLYHLSSRKEIFFMTLGALGSIISAISGPLMSYNFGGAINNFSDIKDIESSEINLEKTKLKNFSIKIDIIIKRYLILGIILFISNFFHAFGWQYSAFFQIHNLKQNYFSIIMRQEQEYFDKNNSFELVTKVQNQLEQIELGLGEKFGYIFQKFFHILVGISISLLISWRLTLIILAVFPITLFLIIYFTKISKRASIISKKAYQKAGGIAEEMLYNIETIYSFANFEFELERFNKNIDIVFKCDEDKAFKASLSKSLMGLSCYIAFVIAIFFGKKLIVKDKIYEEENGLKVGDILIVILNMSSVVWSFIAIAPNLKIIIDVTTSAYDYFSLRERKPKIHYNLFPVIKDKSKMKGIIEFKNVNFSYNNSKKILDNFSLKIEEGKKIALVGESGCGKSTIVNLLERIYEIDFHSNNKEIINDIETIKLKEDNNNNSFNSILSSYSFPIIENNERIIENNGIFLDGVEIKNYDLEFYRSLFGYVQQEPVLFNKSIKDNIIFGREKNIKKLNLNIDDLIKEACDIANASEFINEIGGLDYKVGIQGNKLSGGQKQRIAIARAVLLKPKIIILDEATSSLDYQNELKVQKALDNLKTKNITTIIISHRLNTIINSDIIYFMKDGKILEQGNHKELFNKNCLYKNFIQNQVDESGNLINKDEYIEENTFKKQLISKREINFNNKIIIKEKEKNDIKISSLKKLFQISSGKKNYIIVGIVSSILLGISMTLSGYFFGFIINSLSQNIITNLESSTNFWGIIYSINALFIQLFLFLKLFCLEIISSFITSNLRKMILKKYLELDLSFFDKIENSPGALLSKLSMDTVQLNSIFQMIIGDIFHSFGSLISGLILAFYYEWRLSVISLIFIPFIITSNLLISKTRRSGSKPYKKINLEAGAILSESVLNTKTIFSFNFQKESIKLYKEVLNSETKTFLKDSIWLGILMGFGIFCSFANHSALFYFSKKYFLNNSLDYKAMNLTIQILDLMTRGITNGIRGIFDIKIAKSSFRSILDLLNIESDIDHTKEGNKDKIPSKNILGKIEFKNLNFKYPIDMNENEKNFDKILEKEKYVLKDVNFTINPGQKVAIVGFSGSGKSTLIKLIERFYEPEIGNILIDGIDIKNYNLYELRKQIGYVNQEPTLFKRNIFENIKYGKLNESQNNIIQAAKNASIDYLLYKNSKFIGKEKIIDNNYENIDNFMNNVSGGEKQRISIARIFLKNPKIILLDEPTSSLDKKNEKIVIKNLDKLMKGRTSFIATHRLDSIVNADIILFFKNGKLVQKGTHEELINVEGEYKKLFH